EGSCQYEAVLDHEMRHVEVFKESVAASGERLRRALEAVLERADFPVTGGDREALGDDIVARFEPAFRRAAAAADAERSRRNAEVDTPESYERTRRRCGSW